MSQYRIVITDILLEFLEVAFANILYLRKFYPAEMFVEKKIYSIVTHASQHPQLNEYIDNVLKSIRQWILIDRASITTINLIFVDDRDKRPVEKYVFNISRVQRCDSLEKDPYFLETEQLLRNLCLKLAMSTSYLASLPDESSFFINAEIPRSASLAESESQLSKNFPWVLDKETTDVGARDNAGIDDTSLLPLAIVQSLGLEIYLVEINYVK